MPGFSFFPPSSLPTSTGPSVRWGRRESLLAGLLALVTLAVFSPVCTCDFVNYDDPEYVARNEDVRCGLGGKGLRRAFTSSTAANWHPLTILSLQLDYQLYGLNPFGYHLTNLLLHTANSVLLFVALFSLTGQCWRCFLAAALFAVHPLHVESVAWVSERKDVLSTLFWMLALWAHARYAARPQPGRYLAVAAALAMGLLAKPMLVTLPCVLLLLDGWPLRRLQGGPLETSLPRRLAWLVVEKVPLLGLSAASSIITLHVQRAAGAMVELERLSVAERLANAVRAYLAYLEQTVWPQDLAVFYPHPALTWSDVSVWARLLLFVCLSGLFLGLAHKRPYLAVGWLWYVGTLVPVIGLVQVGGQAQADRYTYVPLIGVFLMLAWGLGELAERRRLQREVSLLAGLVLVWCLLLTWAQVHVWRNSVLLWQHALQVAAPNKTACTLLGAALLEQYEADAAVGPLRQALRLSPQHVPAQHLLGLALLRRGEVDEAVVYLRRAVRNRPDEAEYRNHLGLALLKQGEIEASRTELDEALRLDPRFGAAHYNLGVGYAQQKRWAEASAHFQQAVELEPEQAGYRQKLADARAHLKKRERQE